VVDKPQPDNEYEI